MAKIVCVLYDDPVDGYPKSYARDDLPKIEGYPGGQTLPTPEGIDFKPGTLLGSVSGELGLRKYLESHGHTFVVTSDKDGPDSVFERELVDADIVISQPFWPAYLTAERIAKAKNLKLAITAGIGSDHVDLEAAIKNNVTVVEVTYCNSISVSEHVVMMILGLVRNYIPSYQWVVKGGWNIADCVARSYDVEGMHVGTVAAGRIGLAVPAPPQAVRHAPALFRPPPPAGRGREGAGPDLASDRRGHGEGLRRGHHQRAATSRDRASVQRRAAGQDEARRLSGEHGARQDLRPATPSCGRWKAASWRAMRAMSGFRSRRPPTIRGGPCRITA